MELVHCNKCFTLSKNNVVSSFFVSDCGHIVCEQCVQGKFYNKLSNEKAKK